MKVNHPYKIGSNYLIRTVTMIYTGKLVAVYDKELVISSASWIADTGRFADALRKAEFNEVASWFMIQYQRHPMLVKEDVVTPLVRLFYKSFLFEGGVSTDGDWMMNFMFHF